jgi:hypothetical protein
MSREAQVRFWESLGVKLPGATQQRKPALRLGHNVRRGSAQSNKQCLIQRVTTKDAINRASRKTGRR